MMADLMFAYMRLWISAIEATYRFIDPDFHDSMEQRRWQGQ